MELFPERLREIRGDMAQDEFGKKIGVSRASLSYYENGSRIPDITTLKRIHEVTGVSLYYLLGLTDSKDDTLATAQKSSGLCEESLSILASNPLYQRVIDKLVCFHDFDRIAAISAALHDETVLRWRNEEFGTQETDDASYTSLYIGYQSQLEHNLGEFMKTAFYPHDDDIMLGAPNNTLPTTIVRRTQDTVGKIAQTDGDTQQLVTGILNIVAELLGYEKF